MSISMQQFLANGTRKAAKDLADAFLTVPVDKRSWSPGGNARTASDEFAECILNCAHAADILKTGKYNGPGKEEDDKERADLGLQSWDDQNSLLQKNVDIVTRVIASMDDERLSEEFDLPWGKSSMVEILAYPYWNMTYHLGQINAIAMRFESE